MVRFCVVPDCKQSDTSGLAHRFPKKRDIRIKWQEALNLHDYDLDVLLQKYVVCGQHFKQSDYRNPLSQHLNTTAIPHLPEGVPKKESLKAEKDPNESTVEIVEIIETEETSSQEDEKKPAITTPIVQEKIVYETVFAQRRRKRTAKEVDKELKKLTKQAYENCMKKHDIIPLSSIQSENIVLVKGNNCVSNIQIEVQEPPPVKTIKILDHDPEQPEVVSSIVELSEVACQTEENPEFNASVRDEFIKLLKEKDETIKALQDKISKFETAMSAFKLLMNP